MHGIIIEVEDYREAVSPETASAAPEQNGGQTLLERLKIVYARFFYDYYDPKLPKNGAKDSIYPRFSLLYDEEVYEISFDEDFYSQICELYIVEGWAIVEAISEKVEAACKDDSKELSGGVKDKPIDVFPQNENVWKTAKVFFTLTRNILALLIRESLIALERFSAERIVAKLSVANIETAKAWSRYKIETETVARKSDSLQGHDVVEKTTVYSIGDQPLAKDLFKLLTAAVNEKYAYEKFARDLLDTQGRLSGKKGFHEYEDAEIESLKKKEKDTRTFALASEDFLEALEKLIVRQHPFGLLIYGSLKKGFEPKEMENLFGLSLDNLRKDYEKIGEKVDPQVPQIKQMFDFRESGDLTRDVFNFQIPAGGLEKYVVNFALENYQNEAFYPFISEENFRQLFRDSVIAEDSFETIVGFHYLSALSERLAEIEADEKSVEAFWKTVGKVSAALSLVLLLYPPARAALAGAEKLANLAILAYAVRNVTETLRKNDEMLGKVLIDQDNFSNASLAQIGEVIALKKEFADNLTAEIAKEIFNIFVGGKLPIFKQYLFARNYYYDLETLAESEENQAAQ